MENEDHTANDSAGPNGLTENDIAGIVKIAEAKSETGPYLPPKIFKQVRAAIHDAEAITGELGLLEDEGKATESQFKRRMALVFSLKRLYGLFGASDGAVREESGLPIPELSARLKVDPNAALDDLRKAYKGDSVRRAANHQEAIRIILPGEDKRLAAMFGAGSLSAAGFDNSREFYRLVGLNMSDPRLEIAAATNTELSGAAGGFIVPTQFLANILDGSLESEIVRPRADVVPMTAPEALVPFWDTQNRTADLGGLKGKWIGETGDMTAQAARFSKLALYAHKLGIVVEASNELLQDGSSAGERLESHIQEAASFDLDVAFFSGTGAGMPHGILNDVALISIAKESGQAAATIVYKNLTKMFSRLHPASIGRAVWVCNQSTIPQLLELFATDGTTSTHVPVLREGGPTGFTMLTRPVIFTEKVPTLGANGDIVLCDFSQYLIGMRLTANIQSSAHVGFMKDTSHFRLILRVDGKGKWKGPVTPKNGPTQSWCVTLDARA